MTMGVRRNISKGGNVDILLIPCRFLTMQSKWVLKNAIPFLLHKENDPCYGNSQKCASLAEIVRYIAIIHTIAYLQIFKAGHFFTKKHCHGLQLNHKLWLYFT